jgi:hypothetical protein
VVVVLLLVLVLVLHPPAVLCITRGRFTSDRCHDCTLEVPEIVAPVIV